MFLSALITMIVAVLAHHLGLIEAIIEVVRKVASCQTCCSFWITLIVLIILWHNTIAEIFLAVALSMLMAYLSNFFGIALILTQKLYNWLWEKANKVQISNWLRKLRK